MIPKSLLNKLGTENLEVFERGREIVIRPKGKKSKISKIRQYYGFMGVTEYDEALIKELDHDWEESGKD